VLEQIRRFLRDAAAFDVRRRSGHDDPARTRKPDVDHVAIDGLDQSDARVEPSADDVDEFVIDANVELYFRVSLHEPRQHTSEDQRDRAARHGEPDATGDFAGSGRDGLQRLERLLHGRARVLQQVLPRIGERHASRRPREQRDAEAFLELPHGLAERGFRYAEIFRRRGEAATPRHGEERAEGVEGGEGHREGFLHHLRHEYRSVSVCARVPSATSCARRPISRAHAASTSPATSSRRADHEGSFSEWIAHRTCVQVTEPRRSAQQHVPR